MSVSPWRSGHFVVIGYLLMGIPMGIPKYLGNPMSIPIIHNMSLCPWVLGEADILCIMGIPMGFPMGIPMAIPMGIPKYLGNPYLGNPIGNPIGNLMRIPIGFPLEGDSNHPMGIPKYSGNPLETSRESPLSTKCHVFPTKRTFCGYWGFQWGFLNIYESPLESPLEWFSWYGYIFSIKFKPIRNYW